MDTVLCGANAQSMRWYFNEEDFGILPEEGRAYRVAYAARPIADAAKETRSLPREFIAKNGHDVTQAFIDYARPLVGDLPPCAVL